MYNTSSLGKGSKNLSLIIVQHSPALHGDTRPALDCKCFDESKSGQEDLSRFGETSLSMAQEFLGDSLGKSG
jgi:hypothetical protein